MSKKIAIGADHGGFKLKNDIIKMLKKAKYQVVDVGTFSDESCDYPEFGYNAAKKVGSKKADKAIVICKTGIGMSIIANKVKGVRAGLCHTAGDALSSRKHNDTNVLVLAASRLTGAEAKKIVKIWLRTRSLKGRHARRVEQIKKLENK